MNNSQLIDQYLVRLKKLGNSDGRNELRKCVFALTMSASWPPRSSVTPIPSDILGFPDMGHGPATLGLGVVDSATRREQQDHGGHR
jgi:hypothetical protein